MVFILIPRSLLENVFPLIEASVLLRNPVFSCGKSLWH